MWASAGVLIVTLIVLIGVFVLKKKRRDYIQAGDDELDGSFPEPDPTVRSDQRSPGMGPQVEDNGGTGILRSPSYFTIETFPTDNRGSHVSDDDPLFR